jgi:hypothetical protein
MTNTSRSRLVTAFAVMLALGTAQLVALTPAAQAAETQLSETGWVASSNTTSPAADAPANAIDANASTRFSSDAFQASGMFFQVNLGSAQSFNQIVLNSGGSAGDYARGYNVQVSANGTTFTSVAPAQEPPRQKPSLSPLRPPSTSASCSPRRR